MSVLGTDVTRAGSETQAILRLVEAWDGQDRQRNRAVESSLDNRAFSGDSLAVLAAYRAHCHCFPEASELMSRAFDRLREEWSRWGRTKPRPSVEKCLFSALEEIRALGAGHRKTLGVMLLDCSFSAYLGQKSPDLDALLGAASDKVPRWFRLEVKALQAWIDECRRYRTQRVKHRALDRVNERLGCPLLEQNDHSACFAAHTEDAPQEPESIDACRARAYLRCPYFVRHRYRRVTEGWCVQACSAVSEKVSRALQEGDAALAMELTREAIRIDPGDADLRYSHSKALRRLGQLEAAYEECTVAADLDSHDPRFPTLLSAMALESNEPRLAEFHADAAIQLDPSYDIAINNKAESLRMQGRLAEAARCYEGLVALVPDDSDYRQALAEVLCQLRRPGT